jgi:hypothetical protein
MASSADFSPVLPRVLIVSGRTVHEKRFIGEFLLISSS